jgi:putative nucleotidyltransferase with HDIG domain
MSAVAPLPPPSPAEGVVASVDGIGTVPSAVAQVFSLINDPRASMADFERVMRPDVGLTANLLRSANSAYYRGSREITSVKDAISRMGLRRVFEVVTSQSFARTIPPKFEGYAFAADSYWNHSITVAVLSDRIGRAAGFTYPDLAFTGGLLHDLGKVAISSWLRGVGAFQVSLKGPLTSVEDERAQLGFDHTEVGEALALKWNLPKDIAAATRWHHDPSSAPTATQRYFATVIQVADSFSAVCGAPEGTTAPALDPASLERLNLSEEKLLRLTEDAKPEEIGRAHV